MPVAAPHRPLTPTPSEAAPTAPGTVEAQVNRTAVQRLTGTPAGVRKPPTPAQYAFHITNPTTMQRRPTSEDRTATGAAGTAAETTTSTADASTSTDEVASPDRVPLDLDDLARKLLEPVARLLRAELRSGRERAGRLHDRRR